MPNTLSPADLLRVAQLRAELAKAQADEAAELSAVKAKYRTIKKALRVRIKIASGRAGPTARLVP